MKKLIFLLLLTSCIKEQEIEPVDQWWLTDTPCTDEYVDTPYETIYRFCWNIEVECNGMKKEIGRCSYTNCEIVMVVHRDYPDCKILKINKVK